MIGNNFGNPKIIELDNNNIMIVGGYAKEQLIIIDNQGNIVKELTQIIPDDTGGYTSVLKMSDNRIMIISCGINVSTYLHMVIVNQNGNIIKSDTNLGQYLNKPQLIEMNNGNIMIIGYRSGGNYPAKIIILDKSGTIVKSATNIGDYYANPQLIETSNNKIVIFGDDGTLGGAGRYSVYDESGNQLIESTTISSVFNGINVIKYSKGNIIAVASVNNAQSTSYKGALAIIDNNGNKLIEKTLGDNMIYPFINELSDNTLLVIGSSSQSYPTYKSLKALSSNINATLNDIDIDTAIAKDKYYELVYNETQNKFIAEEVRNAN